MVHFNNRDIATSQLFKIFIVFIVARSCDLNRKQATIQSWLDLHAVFIGRDAESYYEKIKLA